jgi:hypothetical protein
MRVDDLKMLIEELPDDMLIIMPVGDGEFLAVCNGKSRVQDVSYPDYPQQKMLVLYPCTCSEEVNDSVPDFDPQLN